MPFQYVPLGPSQIPLLESQPSAEPRTLSYRLIHVDLNSKKHKYSAVSYTWGAAGNTHIIKVNGEDFPIRSNLNAVLHQIDDISKKKQLPASCARLLWVDAICINQSLDDEALAERSAQVREMRQVYTQANHVLVGLGRPESERNNRLAFQKIEEIFEKTKKIDLARSYWWWPMASKPEKRFQSEWKSSVVVPQLSLLDVGCSDYHAWLGLQVLWRHQWWTRTWIYQEATIIEVRRFFGVDYFSSSSSPKIFFLFGDQVTTWFKLRPTLQVTRDLENLTKMKYFFMGDYLKSPWSLGKLYAHFHDDYSGGPIQTHTILSILQSLRHTQCNDPRDKVYSPLCLVPRSLNHGIIPDYKTKTVLDVYIDVVKSCLSQSGETLDFLGYAMWTASPFQGYQSLDDHDRFPSWLPDWSKPLDIIPLPKARFPPNKGTKVMGIDNARYRVHNVKRTRAFNASRGRSCSAYISSQELHVDAVFCDNIVEIISIQGGSVTQEGWDKLDNWIRDSGDQYPNGESFTSALNRTLVSDLKYDTADRPSERGGIYDRALVDIPGQELSVADFGVQEQMLQASDGALHSRDICLTKNGYLALIPYSAMVKWSGNTGDKIYAFLGGDVFYTLRPVSREAYKFVYIGEAYVHGLMDGELMDQIAVGDKEVERIVLV